MIYFPKDNTNYQDLGTNFYSKRSNSIMNMDVWESKYIDKESFGEFYENYDVFPIFEIICRSVFQYVNLIQPIFTF